MANKILKRDYVAFLKFANALISRVRSELIVRGDVKEYKLISSAGKPFTATVFEHELVGNLCYSVFFRFECRELHKQNFHYCGDLLVAKAALELHLKYLLEK